mgnify:CR=1 FL=1|jgi:hypothetical protein
MPNPVKLELLLTGSEVLGFDVAYDGCLHIVTDCSRKRIPLYEFRCTRNLTLMLKEHFNW